MKIKKRKIAKIGITQKFDIEDTKHTSQIRVVEVKKSTYGEAL